MEIDAIAESLSLEYKLKGGVSELLRNLVVEFAQHPEKFKDAFPDPHVNLKTLLKQMINELQQEEADSAPKSAGKKK